jgi:hypothetical protein
MSISRCVVDNSRSSAYEVATSTDSGGAFSFTVPQGSRVRFESPDVADLDGWNIVAPNTVAMNLGNFNADLATSTGERGSAVGSVPGPTVIATEYGDAAMRQTVLQLVNHLVTVGNTTGVSFGGSEIYAFPEGRIHVLGCVRKPITFDLSNAGNVTPIAGTMGGDVALGSSAPDDGTLTGSDVDFNGSTSIDPISGGAAGAALSAAAVFDGTSSAIKLYANVLIDDADVADGSSDVIGLNCDAIVITWVNLGDTA